MADALPPRITGLELLVSQILETAQEMVDQGRVDERGREEYVRRHLTHLLGQTTHLLQRRLIDMRQMSGDAGQPNITYELVRDLLETGGENIHNFVPRRWNKNKRKPGRGSSSTDVNFHIPDDIRKELESFSPPPVFDDVSSTSGSDVSSVLFGESDEDSLPSNRREFSHEGLRISLAIVRVPNNQVPRQEVQSQGSVSSQTTERQGNEKKSLKRKVTSFLGRLFMCQCKRSNAVETSSV